MQETTEPKPDLQLQERILERLVNALRADGDYPNQTRVVTELRRIAQEPDASVQQVAQLILSDSALGTRVLHIVNSAYYQGNQEITTITDAVIRLGMNSIADLCAGLVLLKRFFSSARQNRIFSANLQSSLLTALLTRALNRNHQKLHEQAYLTGTLYSLGHLLLGFYFPKLYEAAAERSLIRGGNVQNNVAELLGFEPSQLSLVLIDELKIPAYYSQAIISAHSLQGDPSLTPDHPLAHSLVLAEKGAQVLVFEDSPRVASQQFATIATNYQIELADYIEIIKSIQPDYDQLLRLLGIDFLRLPEYLPELSANDVEAGEQTSAATSIKHDRFQPVRQAIFDGEPFLSVVALTLETLHTSLPSNGVHYYQRVSASELNRQASLGTVPLPTSWDPEHPPEIILGYIESRQSLTKTSLDGPLFGSTGATIPIWKNESLVGYIFCAVDESTATRVRSDLRAIATLLKSARSLW